MHTSRHRSTRRASTSSNANSSSTCSEPLEASSSSIRIRYPSLALIATKHHPRTARPTLAHPNNYASIHCHSNGRQFFHWSSLPSDITALPSYRLTGLGSINPTVQHTGARSSAYSGLPTSPHPEFREQTPFEAHGTLPAPSSPQLLHVMHQPRS